MCGGGGLARYYKCGCCGVIIGFSSFDGLAFQCIFNSWVAELQCLWFALNDVHGFVPHVLIFVCMTCVGRCTLVLMTRSPIEHPYPRFLRRVSLENEGSNLRATNRLGLVVGIKHVEGILCIDH